MYQLFIYTALGIDNNVWDKQNPSLLVYEIGDHFLDFTNEKKHRFLNFVIEAVLRQLAFLKLLISNLAKLNGKNQILASSRTI